VKIAPDVRHLVGFAILVSLCILVVCLPVIGLADLLEAVCVVF